MSFRKYTENHGNIQKNQKMLNINNLIDVLNQSCENKFKAIMYKIK